VVHVEIQMVDRMLMERLIICRAESKSGSRVNSKSPAGKKGAESPSKKSPTTTSPTKKEVVASASVSPKGNNSPVEESVDKKVQELAEASGSQVLVERKVPVHEEMAEEAVEGELLVEVVFCMRSGC
jgi:hypothetical protein